MPGLSIASTRAPSRFARLLGTAAPSAADDRVGRQLVYGAFGNLALNVTTVLSNFLIAVLLARALGPSGYGAYAIATTWAIFLTVVALLGLPPLIIRKVAEYRVAEAWGLVRGLVRSVNRAVIFASLACGAFGGVVGWFLYGSNQELRGAYLLALLLIPLTAIQSVRQAVLTGLGRTVLARVPAVLVSTAGFAVALAVVAVLPVRLSPVGAVGLNTATTALAFVVSGVLLLRLVPRAARTAAHMYEQQAWRRSALPLLLSSGIQTVNAQAGLILLGVLKPAADAGKYGISLRAAMTISFLLLTVGYPVGPTIARLYAQGDLSRVQRVVTQSARAVVLLTLPFAVAMIVYAGPILHVLFGARFEGATPLLRILAAGEAINVLTGLTGEVLLMTGQERKMVKGISSGAAMTLGLSLSLIPIYGALGAAIATAAGTVTSNLLLSVFAWRSVRIYAPAIRFPRLPRG